MGEQYISETRFECLSRVRVGVDGYGCLLHFGRRLLWTSLDRRMR